MKGYICSAVAVTLTGCVQIGAVTKMGPDKYEVTALVAGMHGGAARAQTLALEEAKKYCASMNKEIFVAKAWQPDEYVESSEVTFHCLDKDD